MPDLAKLFPSNHERTPLSEAEERRFRGWIRANKITDLDHPESFYDYRGYWKDVANQGLDQRQLNPDDHKLHFPDTYKQHGHPTFSQESMYSRGAWDGGKWVPGTDTLLQPPPLAVSHTRSAR